MAKRFADLTDQEILALAISNEEEDSRVYGDIAAGLRKDYPATAKVFEAMQVEEQDHRRQLPRRGHRPDGQRDCDCEDQECGHAGIVWPNVVRCPRVVDRRGDRVLHIDDLRVRARCAQTRRRASAGEDPPVSK